MSKYMKAFVYTSLVHLALAAIIGALNGIYDMGYAGSFAHTHFNLLGFMAQMVFGIGYFILPRFNGSDLRFPSWVPVHFWLGNIGLWGMIIFRALEVETGEGIYTGLFIACATVQVITIFMFVINTWLSLSPQKADSLHKATSEPKPAPKASTTPVEPATPVAHVAPTAPATPVAAPAASPTGNSGPAIVSSESRIADLIDSCPSVKDLLVKEGLRSLDKPGHLDMVRNVGVTIGVAGANHGLDVDRIIALVQHELDTAPSAAPITEFAPDLLIGRVMEEFPETRVVFQKHFGEGCFDCPGQSYESIDMACRMHGVEPSVFIKELNATMK